MKPQRVITLFLAGVCLVSILVVRSRQGQIASLQAENQRLTAEVESVSRPEPQASPAVSRTSPPRELLRLRNEVTALQRRERELAGVRAEYDRLRDRQSANPSATVKVPALPEGYVPRSKLQFRGYSTPEAAVESWLWALRNHDVTNYLEALTPETAQAVVAKVEESATFLDDLFENTDDIPGFRIVESQTVSNGVQVMTLEWVPGLDVTFPVPVVQINGQWLVHPPPLE